MKNIIPCWMMRGGTSKAVFFKKSDLPPPGLKRDEVISSIIVGKLGQDPTGMQLDGLGGGISSTSKIAIISKSSSTSHTDLDYEFGQVGLKDGNIDWTGTCGNISSAVLLYAQLNRMMPEKQLTANVLQVNNGMLLKLTHHPNEMISIPGVFGKSFAIDVELLGIDKMPMNLLPTGNTIDVIEGIQCTMIRFANPTVIIRFKDVESLINESWVYNFRKVASKAMGINFTEALRVAFIEPSKSYKDSGGNLIKEEDTDFFARITTPSRIFHHALTSTGSANLALSAQIPGTITNMIIKGKKKDQIKIGTIAGVIELYPRATLSSEDYWVSEGVKMKRTARALVEGFAYL